MDYLLTMPHDYMMSGYVDLPWWGCTLVALALTHITIASVTIFLHRHQAHRALDLHPLASHFFRFWLWLTTGMITREWAAVHRKHHAKCETPDDPHSPQVYGLNRVLWGGVLLYRDATSDRETLTRYGHGTPDDWIERKLYSAHNFLGIALLLGVDGLLFGIVPGLLIWVTQMLWIPFWAAGVINGVGHFWGYRNFNCADASTNIVPFGILIGGEELHNNHHAFSTSAKLSARWFEFDIGWAYIRLLSVFGLARVKKVIPIPRFAPAGTAVDFDTLQAIITHRYDVVKRYVASLHDICRDEIAQLRARAVVIEDDLAKRLGTWLAHGESALGNSERQQLARVLNASRRLTTVFALRQDLEALWARSTASREQLLKQLHDWCLSAEQSGIRQLEEFSGRLKRYTV